ncbi:hypothetical protein K469DRAFT_189273 [Zopfia rhizophila CBS 207.26]|uniref:Zn(2)-C6 fungal-type domain-containing protein n=1 Tax=Zopfia rhizophila CBS 207.26 TaxID=1314779 RepID=A0A6A6ETD4_9PEZI|nr:hypothetical protein K469DRAFT_189273 [Zopfia rhizophila CBS 207.26]
MTTPDAEDASPSPEYSGDPDGSEMAEQKAEQASSDASPSKQTGNGQKPASNAKDPLRPRRKKARRACFACQRAHLTCGDERPCHRCIKRNLQEHCMDGIRKKAKYLHDAPNEALMPGVGGNFPHFNGNHPASVPGQDPGAVSQAQQGAFYTQAPTVTYYPQSSPSSQVPSSMQDGPIIGTFSNQQPPISPPYSQTNQPPLPGVPSTVSQGTQSQMQQFGGPLFDPSDPALFNFDISSLNFGNHYGALEFGMLGHMSSGAADTPPSDNSLLNPLNQAANAYQPQMSSGAYNENPALTANIAFGPDGLPSAEWQNTNSRHGSIQMQTPNNTPVTINLDSQRHDSLNGPHAFAIGQGPSSLSSASPASTDVNSGYDNDNPLSAASFFANSNQHQLQQRSPTVGRAQQDQRGLLNTALQPIQFNAVMRRRRRDTSYIYNGVAKGYEYTAAFHRIVNVIKRRFSQGKARKISQSMAKYRPILIASAADQTNSDLVHCEKNLQRQLVSLEDMIHEWGSPVLICRRTGEVVLMGKEFTMLTGWKREVLLGKEPNLNVNTGQSRDSPNESGLSSRTSVTPTIAGQEPDSGPHPVSIVELMDEDSVIQWFEDFAELAYQSSHGTKTRRVKMLKYLTEEDMTKLEEFKANAIVNGKPMKPEPTAKLENAIAGEGGIGMLGAKDGMVDCMINWHMKRDIFDGPGLIVMNILPVLQA